MKKIIAAIAFLLILVSCTKEEQEQFPSQLIATSYQATSYPKVYTRLGEVTDRAVADAYLQQPTGNYFSLTTDSITTTPADTITYLSGDTVLFSLLPVEWGKRVVKKQGQLIYFFMTDTLWAFKTEQTPLNDIEKEIGTFKPYTKDVCFSTAGCPYQELYDAFIATGSSSQLELPLITYKITRTTSANKALKARSNYNNLFNPSVIGLLQDGDTLAVQTLKRVYSK